ncbi:hypothetical protein [Sporomusa aerivorans]
MKGQEYAIANDHVWLYLLYEAQLAEQEGLAEQAWQYVTEFSPDYRPE